MNYLEGYKSKKFDNGKRIFIKMLSRRRYYKNISASFG